jgi:hypothetical protein
MKNLSLLFFLLAFISLNVHSQKKYDIAICTGGINNGYGTNLKNLNDVNLEFRNQINEKWRLNFGLSTSAYRPSDSRLAGYNSSLYSISDTSITYRKSEHYQSMISIRLGAERVFHKQFFKNPFFKTRVLSYGFDVLLGKRKYVLNKYNSTTCYDSLYFPLPNNYNYKIFSNSDRYESNLFNGALQFSLKANLPINKRLTFSITSLSSMDFILKLNENYDISAHRYTDFQTANLAQGLTIDPNSPLLDIEPLSNFDILLSSKFFIGIRYSFGGGNEIEVLNEE